MANPEERPDDRPELPTRVPFAEPFPGTAERDWKSPVDHAAAPPVRRPRSSLAEATGIPRQRSGRVGGVSPGPAPTPAPAPAPVAPPAPADRVTAAEPAGAVRPWHSRVLPAAVAASILVAGGLWWSQDRAAPAAPQTAPAPAAAPTMRITAPADGASAGVGSDTAPALSASAAGPAATVAPAAPGASPRAKAPAAKPAKSSPPPGGAAVNTAGRNLALGAQATASSVEGRAWVAANAVDGDLESRWSSQFSDPQWFMVDLGKRWEVSTILLHWENAHATAYRVEVSTDGRQWKQVYSTADGQGGDVTVQVPKLPVQQVRMYGTKRSTDYGFSLLDVEVR